MSLISPSEATSWRWRDQPDARAPAGDGCVDLAEAFHVGKSDRQAISIMGSHMAQRYDQLKLKGGEKVQCASPTVYEGGVRWWGSMKPKRKTL